MFKFFFVALLVTPAALAQTGLPSLSGQTGLISMPDARIAPEGAWRSGISFLRPYHTLWTSLAPFPWLEGGFRYIRHYYVPGFPDDPDSGYGDFRDRSFDAKIRLLPERTWLPALSLGMQDVAGGTERFSAPYVVASKRLGTLDLTLGYGNRRLDGAFGGLRWYPSFAPGFSAVAEYDAFNYQNDQGAELSGAARFRKDTGVGLEYRYGWLGAQVFREHDETGFNVYVSVPLEQREFVPKTEEPRPYTKINPRPSEEQWREDPEHAGRLARALDEQNFHSIGIGYQHGRLEASLGNSRISSMPRAVGRAARTLLSFAPLEVNEIRIVYYDGSLPVATYTFKDTRLLQRYFNGMARRQELAPTVVIEYADPAAVREQEDRAETLEAFLEPLPESLVLSTSGVDFIALRGQNIAGGRFLVRPSFSTFLNDPSGIFKYDLSLIGSYDRPLGNRLFFRSQVNWSVYEDISDVAAEDDSNSDLPHVRTDYGLYSKNDVKLTKLLLNKFFHPAARVYARASGGIFEEMYSGLGGQVLYLGRGGGWGLDLDVNFVKKRDPERVFGHVQYETVTTIASLNYRMAKGVTATLRAGQFLARDEGVRLEVKRRFASNWEAGAWYTITNGNDIQSPGAPGDPYYDKGIFLVWRLDTLLSYDTQAATSFSLSPWTRDVGQMVESPGDLYSILEDTTYQMHYRDGLSRFGDRNDDYDLPRLGADRRWPEFVLEDAGNLGAGMNVDWKKTALGAALLLGSSAFDESAFESAERRKNSRRLDKAVQFGDALPIAALGLSAVFAFDESRVRLSDAGAAALEASALAAIATEGLKWGVGRARPQSGLGNSEFESGASQDRFKSFPSRHTSVMWAAITPYAKEYDMPWLYAVAALTNASRVASREHWVSDTVGGSLLGYAIGHLAWAARRESRYGPQGPSLVLGPGWAGLSWSLP